MGDTERSFQERAADPQAYAEGGPYEQGRYDEREHQAAHWQKESDEHMLMAKQRHAQAMEASGSLYTARMASAKTHRTLSDTYGRVARTIRGTDD